MLGICIEVLQRLNIPPYMYRVGLRNMFFHPEQVIFAIHKKVGAISVEYFSNRKVTGQNSCIRIYEKNP